MRVLCTTQPLYGHLHSVMPYALELRAQGHEVAFATARRFAPVIEALGFPVFACGVDFDAAGEIFSTLPGCQAIRRQGLPTVFEQLWGFILGLGPQMAADLLTAGGAWRPDLVLRDPVEFGSYIAAERWGIPHVSVLWAIYINPRVWIPPWLAELRDRFDLPPDPAMARYDRWLLLKSLPASWSIGPPGEPAETRAFCAPPFDRSHPEPLPAWIETLLDCPIVYATLGTTFNDAPALFRAVIDALAGLDVTGIVTVGQRMDPAQFGALPANVHVERYIAQSAILPRCAAVIFHGGFNTLHSALWHGLPMAVIPLEGGDQAPTAAKCAELGIGIEVAGQPPQADAIRCAVADLLEQPTYRARAQEMAAAMRALPPLSEAVRLMEALAAHAPA